jgi:hypothetical protein
VNKKKWIINIAFIAIIVFAFTIPKIWNWIKEEDAKFQIELKNNAEKLQSALPKELRDIWEQYYQLNWGTPVKSRLLIRNDRLRENAEKPIHYSYLTGESLDFIIFPDSSILSADLFKNYLPWPLILSGQSTNSAIWISGKNPLMVITCSYGPYYFVVTPMFEIWQIGEWVPHYKIVEDKIFQFQRTKGPVKTTWDVKQYSYNDAPEEFLKIIEILRAQMKS